MDKAPPDRPEEKRPPKVRDTVTDARLKAALLANIARRKAQANLRDKIKKEE